MKKIEIGVLKDRENPNSFFVEGIEENNGLTALAELEKEYPEIKGFFNVQDGEFVPMQDCLDCGSGWVTSDDEICGECGEYRLSKKKRWVWWFYSKEE